MDGQTRRIEMIKMLQKATKPLSGAKLGKAFGISRQVVVQDIALLRAEGYDLLATARGYILNKDVGQMASRIVLVKHAADQMEDELNIVVDNGGRVRNVIVSHSVYGDLTGDLMLKTRRDVRTFVEKVNDNEAALLSVLTTGIHMHTIEAPTEEELDIIEDELKQKGYLA